MWPIPEFLKAVGLEIFGLSDLHEPKVRPASSEAEEISPANQFYAKV